MTSCSDELDLGVTLPSRFWWERSDLNYRGTTLHLEGADLLRLASSLGTPLYVYSALRVRENLERLHRALSERSLDYRIFFAMKANRYPPLLTYLKTLGRCGVDVCSPGELALARQVGFEESEISYTGTSMSEDDLDRIERFPEVWINCDSLSAIRRLGKRCAGRAIGIRVNPGLGIGYRSNELLRYAGEQTTKFGVYHSAFLEALETAERVGLVVSGLHFHAGCGYLTPQLGMWERVLDASLWFLDRVPGIRHVNVGGGLGIPLVADDDPLNLDHWADTLAAALANRGLQIWVEPGDYIVKDAGVLVLRTNTIEEKAGTCFVGVNGGFNVHIEPAFYRLPLEVVPVRQGETQWRGAGDRDLEPGYTIAGNINEALDILAEGATLAGVREGDFLAFLNAGGYGAAMRSNHCMRGTIAECLIL